METKARIISSFLFFTFLCLSGAALAYHGPMGDADGKTGRRGIPLSDAERKAWGENRLEEMAVMLDLSTEQKQQLATLEQQHKAQRQQLRDKIRAGRDQLHERRLTEPFNEAEFRVLAENHARLNVEMMVLSAKYHHQKMELLTPEQREKANKLRVLHMERKQPKADKFQGDESVPAYGKCRMNRDCPNR